MQLIYLYIRKFRNLTDIKANLTPTYTVSYESQNKTLTFTKNDTIAIGQLLYGDNVLSVHGIVGRNAVGKTNIADLISLPGRYRKSSDPLHPDAYFLLYYSEQDGFYIEMYDESSDSETQLLPSLSPYPKQEDAHWHTGWIDLNHTHSLPLWSAQQPTFPVSIISLSETMKQESFLRDLSFQNNHHLNDAEGHRYIAEYASGSFAHQYLAMFLLRKIAHSTLGEQDSDNARPFDDASYGLLFHLRDSLKKYPECFPGINEPFFAQAPAYIRFLIHVLCEFISVNVLTSNEMINAWIRSEASISFRPATLGTPFYKLLQNLCQNPDKCQRILDQYINQALTPKLSPALSGNPTENLLDFIHNFLRILPFSPKFIRIEDFQLLIFVDFYELSTGFDLQDFLASTFLKESAIFDSYWQHTSDGEAHLTLGYATLYQALENAGILSSGTTSDSACLLILDEPELHSHPDLERSFLLWMTQWLESVSEKYGKTDQIRYQFLILTHSPFLLSDIEYEYILHLKRDPSGKVITEKVKEQTFASNIHNILDDTIFLDQAMGAAAYRALHTLIQDLNASEGISPQCRFKTQDEQIFLISKIGEPIIREAFLQAFREHYPETQKEGDELDTNSAFEN